MKRETKYEICGDYVKVFTKNEDRYFLCDIEDLENAKNINWCITAEGYVKGYDREIHKTIVFHKMIFPVRKGYVTDHINRNRSDNRKSNLREVTIKENSNNKVNQQHLPAKGVRLKKSSIGDRYIVNVHTNDFKTKYIGVFDTLEDAIKARDKAYLDIKGVPFPYI